MMSENKIKFHFKVALKEALIEEEIIWETLVDRAAHNWAKSWQNGHSSSRPCPGPV